MTTPRTARRSTTSARTRTSAPSGSRTPTSPRSPVGTAPWESPSGTEATSGRSKRGCTSRRASWSSTPRSRTTEVPGGSPRRSAAIEATSTSWRGDVLRCAMSVAATSSGFVWRLRHGEVEPVRQLGDPALYSGAQAVVERRVSVDRVHEQLTRLVVGARIHLAHQLVTMQDGQCVVAPAALLLGLVHLQGVVEAEQVGHPLAIVQEEVE